MLIDVHNHLYPKEWLDYLESHSKTITIRKKEEKILIYFKGTRLATIEKKGHLDVEERIKDMDEKGIDVNLMSLTTPSVELLPKRDGVFWAKKLNDYFASICQKSKGRLHFLATLPIQDVLASVKELERAKRDLDAKGVIMFSNVAGKPIYFQEFYPIYEAASNFDLPILVHPGPPITTTVLKKVMMPIPLFGFIMDTTIAVAGLILFGVFDRFQNLKVIHPHLGGVFPYLVRRVDDAYETYGKDFKFSAMKKPSIYYKTNVYIDTVSFHLPAMRCAIEYMGIDHVLFGTDYPHPIGGVERAIESLKSLNLSTEEGQKIFSENAKTLFKL
ncbi:MAG: amidohydrolase [Desulfobacterota bacterium]|nr:amidohydrolase [Thermodesulfobacteriota bacterium]MDW8001882.1 amidohydrolase family protein [Deltaproteobacteria bacterium]